MKYLVLTFKLTLLLMSIFVILEFSGCTLPRPPVVTPPKYATISLPALYLTDGGRFCSASYEGLKGLEITIAVDLLNTNGSIKSNFKTFKRNVNNNDQQNTDFQNIEIPNSGTFSVTVTTSNSGACFTCCITPNQYNACYPNGGRPVFRGVSAVYNSNSSPTFIRVVPRYSNCQ